MITPKKNTYLGLDLVPIYIEDISESSIDYLSLHSMPIEFTSGRNFFKILGTSKLKPGTEILVEILDASGNVVYSEVSTYFDSLKRRLVTVEITRDIVLGLGTIVILATLQDNLVPNEFKDNPNFKWKKRVQISPNKPNTSDIIFQGPPIVFIESKLKSIVDSVYRGNYYLSSNINIGTVNYINTGNDDFTGDFDNSYKILQPNEVLKILGTYTSGSVTGSVTSFGSRTLNKVATKDSTFYSTVVRNSPIIRSTGFQFTSYMNGARIYVTNPKNIYPNSASGTTPSSVIYDGYIETVQDNTTAKLVDPFILHLTNSINNPSIHKVRLFDDSNFLIQFTNNKIPTTVPTITSSTNVYEVLNAFLDVNFVNLTPLCGDITRIKIYALESNKPGDYQELDSYTISLVDTLLDTNYSNHINYINSPYRLTGFFAPTLLPITSSVYDTSSFSVNQFTSSHWLNTNLSTGYVAVSKSNFSETGISGTCSFNGTTASFSGSDVQISFSRASIIAYSGSNWIPLPTSSTYPIVYQVTYDVLANMNSGTYQVNIIPLLISSSVNLKSTSNINVTGSRILDVGYGNTGQPNPSAGTGSYMSYLTLPPNTSAVLGMYFYTQVGNPFIIGTPYTVSASIANVTVTEIGSYDEIINSYWTIASSSVSSPVTSSAKYPLIDSVYISGSLNNNTSGEYFLFSSKDYFKFWENTNYVIRFNALARKDTTGKIPKITIWSQNSGSSGAPFKYSPTKFGQYIGEIQPEFNEDYHYYDQVEMTFTAQTTGLANIVFQINQGLWNLSEISVKEYDPIGFTPNHVRLLAKIPGVPGDYEGIILSFKVEYYNSEGKQSEYVTYINDIRLTNLEPLPTTSGKGVPTTFGGIVQSNSSIPTLTSTGSSSPSSDVSL